MGQALASGAVVAAVPGAEGSEDPYVHGNGVYTFDEVPLHTNLGLGLVAAAVAALLYG
jgi:hypothetical protein